MHLLEVSHQPVGQVVGTLWARQVRQVLIIVLAPGRVSGAAIVLSALNHGKEQDILIIITAGQGT